MKKLWVLGIAAILLMAAQAMAATIKITQDAIHDPSGGGPFTIRVTVGSLTVNGSTIAVTGNTFRSFCVEHGEYINSGGSYTAVVNPNEAAVLGGTGSSDVISVGTAYLFAMYSGTINTTTNSQSLQEAIWYLEDEISLSNPDANTYLAKLVSAFGSIANAQSTNAVLGQYGVYVLNLYEGTVKKQDQLIHVPDGGLTVMLLGIAIGGLTIFSRKFRG